MFAMMPPHARGEKAFPILIVTATGDLEDEFRQALTGIYDRRCVLFTAPTYREALEMARARQPWLVLVDVDRDVALMLTFLRDLHDLVPGTRVAAALSSTLRERSEESQTGAVIELLRANVRDFLRRPVSTTELRMVLDRMTAAPASAQRAATGRLVSFISNKGGVGKSTLAVNSACALARRHPGRVLLVDTSLQLGICALMLDVAPTTTIVDAIRQQERLDETLLENLTLPHASGLRLLAAPSDALDAAEVTDEALARILYLARRAFDYVIVDTFPLIDNVVMAILDASDLVFLVVQGTAPSVAGAARLLPVLESLGFPASRQRVVLARNYKSFVGDLTRGDIETRLGRAVDFEMPYEKRILVTMNTGIPRVLAGSRWSRFSRAIARLVVTIDGPPEEPLEMLAIESSDARSRVANDRRTGFERRRIDFGHPGGNRRSGLDRRATVSESHRLEATL
jgi:pilus assembly protein CpaE